MTQTLARLKRGGKNFELMVDMENALKFRKGEIDFLDLESETIFTDVKKGERASNQDLENAFNTTDSLEIAKRIVNDGEVQTTQEHRDAEQEKKFKQIVDFLVTNAIDPSSGRPHTAERIKNALNQSHINVKNVPIENQIKDILEKISSVIPIKLDTKKVKIVIPAIYTGKAYGVITQYKEHESWLGNGDLEVIVAVPSGVVMDFYDRLNNVTHGSAITMEVKEE
ncbi:MAG: ribosome assembly factor SBDS [Candidatus Pacearchaeota archaeon]|nr:ribosome assembly factor SBDS [Candidatus Pacearchaeota archaeon]